MCTWSLVSQQLTLGEGGYVFQQAGAHTHSPYHQDLFAEGDGKLLGADIWLPCSPDLNPLDYSIRGVLKTRAQATCPCQREVPEVNHHA